MPGADGVMEGVVVGVAEGADDELEPWGGHRHSERHRVLLILRA
jgi:hypothetical protein